MADRDTITVTITGGLGNQMFQAATGLALSERTDLPLMLNTEFFSNRNRHRVFELDKFPLLTTGRATIAPKKARLRSWMSGWTGKRTANYREHQFEYDTSIESLAGPTVLRGYFQTERYFQDAADLVRQMLMPPASDDAYAEALAQSGPFSVLHVRRGDYLSSKNRSLFAFPGLGYFQDAISKLPLDQPLVVLSDDPRWAAENIGGHPDIHVPALTALRAGLQDLRLMATATHHIIANSSFSWWGAWLAEPKAGPTYAPKAWFVDGKSTQDLIPKRWHVLGS